MVGNLRIGTSGYSYPDWIGVIYPPGLSRSAWLTFYADAFDTVEINSTYYRMPRPDMLASLVRKVNRKMFVFTVKTPQAFTHHRSELPEAAAPFAAALEPLIFSRTLGSVLAQFPFSFKHGRAGLAHLEAVRRAIPAEVPVHVEFRHESWYRVDVLDFLREQELGFVNVDLPPLPGLPGDVTDHVTNGIGYFRFHGRNATNWWRPGTTGDRYDYLYTADELEPWIPAVSKARDTARTTFLFMNNCHRGKSAINAAQLQQRLGLRPPDARPAWERLERRLFG